MSIFVATLLVDVTPRHRVAKRTGHAPTRPCTLTCARVGGTLPHAARAALDLAPLKDPFAPVPPGTPYTMMNGGCEIARWNRVRFLFPGT